jgi:hypothetical protein
MRKLGIAILILACLIVGQQAWGAAEAFDVVCMGSCPYGHSKLDFYDEDAFTTDSAYGVCSCQSISAYADNFGGTAGAANSWTRVNNGIQFEGATADDFETTFDVADPGVDATFRLPAAGVADILAVMTSTLTTNAPGVATSLWGDSSGRVTYEGTADAHETRIGFADPTADVIYEFPDQAAGTFSPTVSDCSTCSIGEVNGIWQTPTAFVYEGSSANAYELTVATMNNNTVDVTLLLPWPDTAGTYVPLITSVDANLPDYANALWGETNYLALEGPTANAHESRIGAVDPVADATFRVPAAAADNYGIMVSDSFTANNPNAAAAIWFSPDTVNFECATANSVEVTITVADATTSYALTLPVVPYTDSFAPIMSTLVTNAPDVANSIWGSSTGQIAWEGSAADAHEIRLVAANATADVIYTLADGAADTLGFVPSTLATNAPNVANSVWGTTTGGVSFEGTADAHQTTLIASDAQISVTHSLGGSTSQLMGTVNVTTVQDSHTLVDGATVVAAYTVVDDSWPAGGVIEVTCAGTKSGANAVFEVQLWIDGAEIGTLVTIATVAGDWKAEWSIVNKTTSSQHVIGELSLDNDTEVIVDHDTDNTNTTLADFLIEVFVESTNGGDAVVHEFCYFKRSD